MVTAQLPLPMVCTASYWFLLVVTLSQQSQTQFVCRVSLNELEDLKPIHSSDPTSIPFENATTLWFLVWLELLFSLLCLIAGLLVLTACF